MASLSSSSSHKIFHTFHDATRSNDPSIDNGNFPHILLEQSEDDDEVPYLEPRNTNQGRFHSRQKSIESLDSDILDDLDDELDEDGDGDDDDLKKVFESLREPISSKKRNDEDDDNSNAETPLFNLSEELLIYILTVCIEL